MALGCGAVVAESPRQVETFDHDDGSAWRAGAVYSPSVWCSSHGTFLVFEVAR